MEKRWYRFSLHGVDILAPLTAQMAAKMRADGIELEPAAEPDPEWLSERLAPVVALLTGGRRTIAGYS